MKHLLDKSLLALHSLISIIMADGGCLIIPIKRGPTVGKQPSPCWVRVHESPIITGSILLIHPLRVKVGIWGPL